MAASIGIMLINPVAEIVCVVDYICPILGAKNEFRSHKEDENPFLLRKSIPANLHELYFTCLPVPLAHP